MYSSQRGFRESVESVSSVVEEVLGWEPAAHFRGENDPPSNLEITRRNEVIHLGMVQIAQIDVWREMGVLPAGILALSLGEVIAPYAAGSISRDDTARILAVVAHMSVIDRESKRMFVLNAESSQAMRLCRAAPAPLTYLGSILPSKVFVMGDERDSEALRIFLRDVLSAEIATDWISHTPALNIDRDWIRHQLRGLTSRAPSVPVYLSSAGGRFPQTATFDVDYVMWLITRPFHYADAVRAAFDDGFRAILHIGAEAGVTQQIARAAANEKIAVRFVHSMRTGNDVQAWREAVNEVRSLRPTVVAPANPPVTPDTVVLGTRRSAGRAFEIYEELRRGGPVQYLSRHGYWIVLGFEEAESALANPQVFSSRVEALLDADPVLLGTDPPDHTAVRELMSRYFTPADVVRRTAYAEQTAERLLQPLVAGKEFDVVREFSNPLMWAIGSELLGLSAEDTVVFAEAESEANGESGRLYELLDQPMRQRAPRCSMYRDLLGSFTEDQARSLVRLLWLASTMETRRLLPLAILVLLKNEAVRKRIQAEPGRMSAFFDEVVRLYPPEHLMPRRTTADVEIGGRLIPEGSLVRICIAAANRDPRRFDDPAAIHLDGKRPSHLAFGSGVHRCLGAPLAKAQIIVALRALFRLAPDFRVVQPIGTVRWADRGPLREIMELVIGR